jgi:Secretion system C-terminal sorting domain
MKTLLLVTCLCRGVANAGGLYSDLGCPTSIQPSLLTGGGGCVAAGDSLGLNSTYSNQFYTFLHNGQPIPGHTNIPGSSTTSIGYTIPAATAAYAGSYSVVTFDACGDSLVLNTRYEYFAGVVNLSVSAVDGSAVKFNWGTLPSGSGYYYGLSLDPATAPTNPQPTTDTFALVAGLAPGTRYTIFVSNQGSPCNGGWDTLSFVTPASGCSITVPAIQSNSTTNVICGTGSVGLRSPAATGNQWYKNGVAIAGATQQTFSATQAGSYTVTVADGSGCFASSGPVTVTAVDPGLSTPMIYPSSAVTLCHGDSIQLNSSATAGNQWFIDGAMIVGDSNESITVKQAGSYSVEAGLSGCVSMSPPVLVSTIGAAAVPTISIEGVNSLCVEHSIPLLSSADSNNTWYLNGTAIDSANGIAYTATQPGNYTVVVDAGTSCAASSAVTTINSGLDSLKAIITRAAGVLYSDSATGNQWYLNDTLITGATDKSYTATVAGIYTLRVFAHGCYSEFSAPDTVTAADLGQAGADSVKIFPNPAVSTLTIVATTGSMGSTVTIQLFDLSGRQLLMLQGVTGPVTVDVSHWARGPYVVLVTDEGTKEKTRKLFLRL